MWPFSLQSAAPEALALPLLFPLAVLALFRVPRLLRRCLRVPRPLPRDAARSAARQGHGQGQGRENPRAQLPRKGLVGRACCQLGTRAAAVAAGADSGLRLTRTACRRVASPLAACALVGALTWVLGSALIFAAEVAFFPRPTAPAAPAPPRSAMHVLYATAVMLVGGHGEGSGVLGDVGGGGKHAHSAAHTQRVTIVDLQPASQAVCCCMCVLLALFTRALPLALLFEAFSTAAEAARFGSHRERERERERGQRERQRQLGRAGV